VANDKRATLGGGRGRETGEGLCKPEMKNKGIVQKKGLGDKIGGRVYEELVGSF